MTTAHKDLPALPELPSCAAYGQKSKYGFDPDDLHKQLIGLSAMPFGSHAEKEQVRLFTEDQVRAIQADAYAVGYKRAALARPEPASTPWDYQGMEGLPNEEVAEFWRASGHGGTVPFSFSNLIQERMLDVFSTTPAAASVEPASAPVEGEPSITSLIEKHGSILGAANALDAYRVAARTKKEASTPVAVGSILTVDDTKTLLAKHVHGNLPRDLYWRAPITADLLDFHAQALAAAAPQGQQSAVPYDDNAEWTRKMARESAAQMIQDQPNTAATQSGGILGASLGQQSAGEGYLPPLSMSMFGSLVELEAERARRAAKADPAQQAGRDAALEEAAKICEARAKNYRAMPPSYDPETNHVRKMLAEECEEIAAAIRMLKTAPAQPAVDLVVATDEVKTWPERIWLQGNDTSETPAYPGSEGVSWCEESVFGGDVEYVRLDLARAQLKGRHD
jgi:hypothetical protein